MTPVTLLTKTRQIDFKMELDRADPNDAWLLAHMENRLCYESELVQLMLRAIKPGQTVLDAGANVGFFTILMSKLVGEHGRVVAVEPGRNVYNKLEHNIKLNGLKNVALHDCVLWDSPNQHIKFYLNKDSSGGNAVWDPGLWEANTKSRAAPDVEMRQTCTIDLVDGAHKFDFAKLDIEGAEERALMGGRRYALTDCAYIVTELNPFGQSQCGSSEQSLRRLMRGMPYAREMFLLHDTGALPSQVPQESVIEYDLGGRGVKNVLFSTNYDVGKLWPKVPCEIE